MVTSEPAEALPNHLRLVSLAYCICFIRHDSAQLLSNQIPHFDILIKTQKTISWNKKTNGLRFLFDKQAWQAHCHASACTPMPMPPRAPHPRQLDWRDCGDDATMAARRIKNSCIQTGAHNEKRAFQWFTRRVVRVGTHSVRKKVTKEKRADRQTHTLAPVRHSHLHRVQTHKKQIDKQRERERQRTSSHPK